ncbi:MAG: hypothetical protein K9G33_14515 [Sneathiella sp.]|nr:hypothetical protein [Sneathiella sp.]
MKLHRDLRAGILLAATLLVSGCSTDVFKAVDKNISGLFGDSCSIANLSGGEDFCPSSKTTYVQAPVYCYKTLGSVNCYNEENPYVTEHSERVRKVLALESPGSEIITAEEIERRQAAQLTAAATEKKPAN